MFLKQIMSIYDWLECQLSALDTLPVFTVALRRKEGAVDIKLVRYYIRWGRQIFLCV